MARSPTSARRPGIAKARGSYAMTAVAADFDNDGWPDIYVACDSTPSFLFRNNHDGTFREEGLERGVALERGRHGAGRHGRRHRAITNLDGNLDIFKTHFADDTHILYRNDGKGNFDDVTVAQRDSAWRRGSSVGAPASSISIMTAIRTSLS